VTINGEYYRVRRYQGYLNYIDNAIVLLSRKAKASFALDNMKIFLSIDIELSNFKY